MVSELDPSNGNNTKKQDLKDLENLILVTDEKHSKAIQEIRERSSKAMEEIKLMISRIALQNTEVASQSQPQAVGHGIL